MTSRDDVFRTFVGGVVLAAVAGVAFNVLYWLGMLGIRYGFFGPSHTTLEPAFILYPTLGIMVAGSVVIAAAIGLCLALGALVAAHQTGDWVLARFGGEPDDA